MATSQKSVNKYKKANYTTVRFTTIRKELISDWDEWLKENELNRTEFIRRAIRHREDIKDIINEGY